MDRIGRYRIIGELGRGAMGIVYHAVDPSIGRSVAIKTIRIQEIGDTAHRDKLRTRLFREARSAGVLSHPNIVTIYDMDEVEGLAYIAMAFVNGPSLDKTLGGDKPLSGAVMLRVLRQTAAGLDYAHSKGIVHRDVKPGNIMTDEDGVVKIADFGIAKFTAGGHTETKTISGTPNYMSPEQVQGLEIDGRSDQFSLAVIAYEILTGERPFAGEALGTVVYKIVAEQPTAAHRLNGTLTEKIDAVLSRALSKKPDDRYANCTAFITALETACAESRGWQTVAANMAALMPTALVVKTEDLPIAGEPERRRKSMFVPALLSLAVVGGMGIFGAYQSGWNPFEAQSPASQPQIATAPQPAAPKQEPAPTADPPKLENDEPPAISDAPEVVTTKPAAPETPSETRQMAESLPDKVAAKYTSAPVSLPTFTPPHVAPRVQGIWLSSSPGGAKAVLDDNYSVSCITPCTLHAQAGHHRVMFSLPDFISESRDVEVGDGAVDVASVTLHSIDGSIWIGSKPIGATLRVNGRPFPATTPTNLHLPAGDHVVLIERNGQSVERRVKIRANAITPSVTVSFPQ